MPAAPNRAKSCDIEPAIVIHFSRHHLKRRLSGILTADNRDNNRYNNYAAQGIAP